MTSDDISEAAEECARFMERVDAYRERHGHERVIVGSPESGALRRASLDLTRALAKMRRGER